MLFETLSNPFWVLLDGTRRILGIARFSKRGAFPTEEWLEEEKAQGEFHLMSLGRKLKTLERDFDFQRPEGTSEFFTLSAARNCLVHRLGFVGEVDRTSEHGLTVSWMGMEMRTTGTAESHVIETLPAEFQAGEGFRVVVQSKSRNFPIGQQVNFSNSEFTEIGLFLQSYAQKLAEVTELLAALPVASSAS